MIGRVYDRLLPVDVGPCELVPATGSIARCADVSPDRRPLIAGPKFIGPPEFVGGGTASLEGNDSVSY